MADLGDLGDKAKDAVSGEKGEQASDAAIDKAGEGADAATGGRFDGKTDAGEKAADSKIGDER